LLIGPRVASPSLPSPVAASSASAVVGSNTKRKRDH
jgi:hypothetical protein